MMRYLQNIDNRTKNKLLITTFALALFVMFVLNASFSIIYILNIIKQPNFDTISLSIKGGYYVINDNRIGISLILNVIIFFVVWFLMTYHTIKSIYDLDIFLDSFNEF